MRIVIASNNHHKIIELENLLSSLDFTVHKLGEFTQDSIPETGKTFIENALIKARAASASARMPALADDSGLIVPALNNEPGIYSARYTDEGTDLANRTKLINNIKSVSNDQRQAYYYCCLVFLTNPDDPCPIIAEGRWFGTIIPEELGNNGFGYDPCFFVEELQQTAAQLAPQEKNAISHRAIAMKELIRQLQCQISH